MFYSKQAWVGIYFDRGGGLGGGRVKGEHQGKGENNNHQAAPESGDSLVLRAMGGLSGDGSGIL